MVDRSLSSEFEHRKKILVIDTGYNEKVEKYLCKSDHRDFTETNLKDFHGHGSNIIEIIGSRINLNRYCIVVLKWSFLTSLAEKQYLFALNEALGIENVAAINLSLTSRKPSEVEYKLLKRLLKRNIEIFVASGNEYQDLDQRCDVYPACYFTNTKHFHVVGNSGHPSGNYGSIVTDYEYGKGVVGGGYKLTGTSQSTALALARFIKIMDR